MAYKKSKTLDKRIALALDNELYIQFSELAHRNRRNLSDMVRIVMAEAVEFYNKNSTTTNQ